MSYFIPYKTPDLLIALFSAQVTANITKNSDVFSDVTGASVAFTANSGNRLIIRASLSGIMSGFAGQNGAKFIALVDGYQVGRGTIFPLPNSDFDVSCSASLTALNTLTTGGSHIVKLQWAQETNAPGNIIAINAASEPTEHHCVLTVEVLSS